MTNDAKSKTASKTRGRPRKTPEIGGGDSVLEKVLRDGNKGNNIHRGGVLGDSKFCDVNKRVLAGHSEKFFKIKGLAAYIYRFRGQFCLLCFLCLLILTTNIIPNVVWSMDRDIPYEIKDFVIGSGYPGEVVSVTATIKEKTPGRICGVIVNPQVVSEQGHLAFANQTRLIAGESIQSMRKNKNGDILFRTELQVPPTITYGVSKLVVPLEMICEDNQTHASRPIHASIAAPWVIEKKP